MFEAIPEVLLDGCAGIVLCPKHWAAGSDVGFRLHFMMEATGA